MSIRDVKNTLETEIKIPKESRELKDGEVQIVVKAGNATVTLSVHDNQVTVSTLRDPNGRHAVLEAVPDSVSHRHLLSSQEGAFDSAVMVVSQINEA
ncbi:hypothetical protein QA639_28695 [Bradyrhizobium pachyrhizi]|uniref:hypothetical protein n=1 Tax=Bradyrhizobium pachyrhizi TaxID=280333 RepID=UPI0024B042BF|nr:hypothetical protein [Bradyrhizobium pachyrhizi]WFU53620.1 hypothetical protein QA639_28695 [Bradyrhizobium pachyrhizi]